MRRELKVIFFSAASTIFGVSHKAYPDEKGTERQRWSQARMLLSEVTRHIPMRRELKAFFISTYTAYSKVTRHIPMRRELKDVEYAIGPGWNTVGHKAYPDEKGTESYLNSTFFKLTN